MSQERINSTGEAYQSPSEQEQRELEATVEKNRHEQLGKRSPEAVPEREQASHEALEQARTAEQERADRESETAVHEKRDRQPSSKDRKTAYEAVMSDVQSHLSPSSRAFSKFIHAPGVERTSDAVGATVARPNALLAGAVSAFVVSIVVYLVARYYGYPLSGTESIASFVLGWVLGLIFDFMRVMITGKRS